MHKKAHPVVGCAFMVYGGDEGIAPYILFVQQQPQEFVVGKVRAFVGCVQDGIDIVGVILDLLGIHLCGFHRVIAQSLYQQAGEEHHFCPACQVII